MNPHIDKENIFEQIVKNAFEFLKGALGKIETEPKNSLIEFYTAIELFIKI